MRLAHRGEMLGALGGRGTEGSVAGVVALTGFRIRRRRAEAVLLLDVGLAVEPGLAAAIVVFRDWRQPVTTRTDDETAHGAGLAIEGRQAGGGQWRRLLPVGDEQEVGVEFAGHLDRPVQSRRDPAVALPGHAPVEARERAVQRREIGADLDRREQQERPPLGEQGQRDARTAGQLRHHPAQGRLGDFEPARRLAVEGVVAHVHTAGDVHHRQHRDAGAGQRQRPGEQGGQRQNERGGECLEAAVAQVPSERQTAQRARRRRHGPPRGWPGMSVQICFGSAFSSSPNLRSNSGKSRIRREATSKLNFASQKSGRAWSARR